MKNYEDEREIEETAGSLGFGVFWWACVIASILAGSRGLLFLPFEVGFAVFYTYKFLSHKGWV